MGNARRQRLEVHQSLGPPALELELLERGEVAEDRDGAEDAPLGSRTGETVQMTGRLVGPSASATATSSTSGCVRTCPSETVACSGSARQAGNSSAVPPRAVSAANPVSRSAARLNIAIRPVALMATTPLSIVATMFSRYSLAT